MSEDKPKIYRITNLVNEKVYIGCTINTLDKRLKEHIFRCTKTDIKNKLCNSMRKYGVDNFKIDLIEECELFNLYEREKNFIEKFKSFEFGLNSTFGGEGCLGYKHPPEIRKKISDIIKDGKSHKGKTYKDIYGKNEEIEKNKRKQSVKQMWDNLSDEKKEERKKNMVKSIRKKSKYGEEMIRDIKKKINEGYNLKQIKNIYPILKDSYYYAIKNNQRWKDL